jgi:hypothetical protein
LGRIGYITKGPVLADESPMCIERALSAVVEAAERLHLSALVLQPPDCSAITVDDLVGHGFFATPLKRVIRVTAEFDLRPDSNAVLQRMSQSARKHWRQAARRGVTFNWGSRADLPVFFELMRATCRRQSTSPHPSDVMFLECLWDAAPGHIHLALAEHERQVVAGLLLISHGTRLVMWKRGWDAVDPHLHANAFLSIECLLWASQSGYCVADALGMSAEIADAMMSGRGFTQEHSRSRDTFNVRLGARPRQLPPAQLLIMNPLGRRVAAAVLRVSRLSVFARSRLGVSQSEVSP